MKRKESAGGFQSALLLVPAAQQGMPYFLRDILCCDLSSGAASERNFPSLLTALSGTSRNTEDEERETEQRKLELIRIESTLRKLLQKQLEQIRAIEASTIFGARSTIITAVVAIIPLRGLRLDSVVPRMKDKLPFVAGMLLGINELSGCLYYALLSTRDLEKGGPS